MPTPRAFMELSWAIPSSAHPVATFVHHRKNTSTADGVDFHGGSRVARSINTAMVHAYWLIGREIVEVEQHGKERAGYGEGLMKRVAARLSAEFGKSLASPV